jgi:hypothetical protein
MEVLSTSRCFGSGDRGLEGSAAERPRGAPRNRGLGGARGVVLETRIVSRARRQRLAALGTRAAASILLLAGGFAALVLGLAAWGAARSGTLPGDLQRQTWLLLIPRVALRRLAPGAFSAPGPTGAGT